MFKLNSDDFHINIKSFIGNYVGIHRDLNVVFLLSVELTYCHLCLISLEQHINILC